MTEHCQVCHTEVEVCETCKVKKHHVCQQTYTWPNYQGLGSGYSCQRCGYWVYWNTVHQCAILVANQ